MEDANTDNSKKIEETKLENSENKNLDENIEKKLEDHIKSAKKKKKKKKKKKGDDGSALSRTQTAGAMFEDKDKEILRKKTMLLENISGFNLGIEENNNEDEEKLKSSESIKIWMEK